MSVDLARLRELAGKATPGPWVKQYDVDDDAFDIMAHSRMGQPPITQIKVGYCEPIESEQQANAEFIATCDPQTILSLLDRLAALETVVEGAAKFVGAIKSSGRWPVIAGSIDGLAAALSALEQTNAT